MNETKNQESKKIFEVEMNLVHSYEKKKQRNVLTSMFSGQSLSDRRERRDKVVTKELKRKKLHTEREREG